MEATFRRLTEVALTRPAFLSLSTEVSTDPQVGKVQSGKAQFRFGFLPPLSSSEF